MLARDRETPPELDSIRRFEHGWEKAASIRLRVGDESVIDTYQQHGRIAEGTRVDMLDAAYTAWLTDEHAGKRSLLIAGDNTTVTDLNNRARADLAAAGRVTQTGVQLAAGTIAGVGDRVITRENNRYLTTGKGWVKNGDEWIVTQVGEDKTLTVRRPTGGPTIILPADYVAEHVDLGYATTAHRAQGATVDTAHAIVTGPTMSREVLYVAMTRGRTDNIAYVATDQLIDEDTSHGPVEHWTAHEVLSAVLRNRGADLAAHDIMRNEQDTAEGIARLAAEYETIARAAQADRWANAIEHSGLTPEQVNEVEMSPALGPFIAALRRAEAYGLPVLAVLPQLVAVRQLADADDVAAVLHARVERWIHAADDGRVPQPPTMIAGIVPTAVGVTDPDLQRALQERAALMEKRALTRAEQAIERAAPWTSQLGDQPEDPSTRQAWIRALSTVAAYRDRYNVHSLSPLGADAGTDWTRRADRNRTESAVQQALRLASVKTGKRTDLTQDEPDLTRTREDSIGL
jgi:hypothetical protein